jgi:hypothetical protein
MLFRSRAYPKGQKCIELRLVGLVGITHGKIENSTTVESFVPKNKNGSFHTKPRQDTEHNVESQICFLFATLGPTNRAGISMMARIGCRTLYDTKTVAGGRGGLCACGSGVRRIGVVNDWHHRTVAGY